MFTNYSMIPIYIYIFAMLKNYKNYVGKRMITSGPGVNVINIHEHNFIAYGICISVNLPVNLKTYLLDN
jgi:hypothetical protein